MNLQPAFGDGQSPLLAGRMESGPCGSQAGVPLLVHQPLGLGNAAQLADVVKPEVSLAQSAVKAESKEARSDEPCDSEEVAVNFFGEKWSSCLRGQAKLRSDDDCPNQSELEAEEFDHELKADAEEEFMSWANNWFRQKVLHS